MSSLTLSCYNMHHVHQMRTRKQTNKQKTCLEASDIQQECFQIYFPRIFSSDTLFMAENARNLSSTYQVTPALKQGAIPVPFKKDLSFQTTTSWSVIAVCSV